MKKMVFLVVAVFCAILLDQIAYAAETASAVIISELKNDVPEVFHFKEVVNGKNVDINAPVFFPDVDRMPIYLLSYSPLGRDKELNRLKERLSELLPSSDLLVQPMSPWIVSLRSDAAQRMMSHSKRGFSLRFPIIPEEQAVGSTVVPKIPFASTNELLSTLFPDLAFYLKGQHATGGGYLEKANAIGKRDEELMQGPPDEGYETGYYNLLVGQTLHGIRLFPDTYFAIENQGDSSEPVARVSVDSFFDSTAFNMTLQLVRPKEELIEDARLVDYAEITSIITDKLRSGFFSDVESISLGYMLYYAKSYTPAQVEAEEVELIAIPTWEIIADSGWGAQIDGLQISATEKKARSVALHSGTYALRIDALTGEILNKYADPPIRTYAYTRP